MNTTLALESVQYQLARYYLAKLHTAEALYLHGHEHSDDGFALWDQEWSQIKHWGDWATAHASDNDELSRLAKEYAQAGDNIFRIRQNPRERLDWLEKGLIAAHRLDDSQSEIAILYLLGKAYWQLGLVDRAIETNEQALTLAKQTNNRLYISRCLIELGGVLYSQDEYEQSRLANEQALALSRELEAPAESGMALNGLGNIALSEADNSLAYDYYLQYLHISEAHGQAMHICMALRNLSTVSRRLGNIQAASNYAQQSVELCRAIGYRACLAESLAGLGTLAIAQGDLHAARDYYHQSVQVSRQISNHSNEAFVLGQLGFLSFMLGEISTSLEYLEASLAVAQQTEEKWYASIALLHMTEVFRAAGDLERAFEKLSEGMDVINTMQGTAIRAKYILEAALLWRDSGEQTQSAEWAGLLAGYNNSFSNEQQQLYEQLFTSLSEQLAEEIFSASFERGKTLELNDVAEAILSELRQRQVSISQ